VAGETGWGSLRSEFGAEALQKDECREDSILGGVREIYRLGYEHRKAGLAEGAGCGGFFEAVKRLGDIVCTEACDVGLAEVGIEEEATVSAHEGRLGKDM